MNRQNTSIPSIPSIPFILITLILLLTPFLNYLSPLIPPTPLYANGTANDLPACYLLPECHMEGVDLLTGHYSNEVIDLATEGVDPIVLRRFFNSDHPENGWQYSLSKHLSLDVDKQGNYIIHYPDGEGGIALFSSKTPVDQKKKKGLTFCPKDATFLYHTADADAPHLPCYPSQFSGQRRLDNVRIELTEKGKLITAYHGDGTVRRFLPLRQTPETHPNRLYYNLKDKLLIPVMYELERETLPSGNERLFSCLKYNMDSERLQQETRSSTGQFLNYLAIEKLRQQDSWAVTHEKTSVNYQRYGIAISQPNTLGNHYFKEVTGPDGIRHQYDYDKKFRLINKGLPDDRVIAIKYVEGSNETAELTAPTLGSLKQGEYAVSHRFFYPKRTDKIHETLACPEGRGPICVLAANGKLLQYTRNLRPSYGGEISPYSTQKFFWGNLEKREDLVTIALFSDPNTSTATGCRTFVYDTFHNVLEERLYGNLTGTCAHSPVVDDKGKVLANRSESTWTRHAYSSDGH